MVPSLLIGVTIAKYLAFQILGGNDAFGKTTCNCGPCRRTRLRGGWELSKHKQRPCLRTNFMPISFQQWCGCVMAGPSLGYLMAWPQAPQANEFSLAAHHPKTRRQAGLNRVASPPKWSIALPVHPSKVCLSFQILHRMNWVDRSESALFLIALNETRTETHRKVPVRFLSAPKYSNRTKTMQMIKRAWCVIGLTMTSQCSCATAVMMVTTSGALDQFLWRCLEDNGSARSVGSHQE